MESVDEVFRDAVDYGTDGEVPANAPVGVAKLAHVLRVYSAMMSGGFGFAMEVCGLDEFERAVDGFRYLGLTEVADLLSEMSVSYGTPGHDEEREDLLDQMIAEGDLVLDAYRIKAAAVPADFGLLT